MAGSRVSGAKEVAADIRAAQAAIPAAAVDALQQVSSAARQLVVDRTVERYALLRSRIDPLVSVRRTSESAKSATVEIQIKAAPIEAFGPRVQMVTVDVHRRHGKSYPRRLPSIQVSLYRDQAPRLLRTAFPLHRRADGLLGPNDRVRARLDQSANPVENRRNLKKFRYVTFPKRILDPILAEAEQLAGEGFAVTFRAAFRNGRGRLGGGG